MTEEERCEELKRVEAEIEAAGGVESLVETGEHLRFVRDENIYSVEGFETFEKWCESKGFEKDLVEIAIEVSGYLYASLIASRGGVK